MCARQRRRRGRTGGRRGAHGIRAEEGFRQNWNELLGVAEARKVVCGSKCAGLCERGFALFALLALAVVVVSVAFRSCVRSYAGPK